ncbi:SOS response-associated peptidase [Pseudochrobactrum sp. MP213Fo]|uniref:SOS response-associated peptidase n=1 Tax=Pseudochrobactrum sp. MP213Fo TaxID=3022250 RepID=UPI003BA2148C
MCNLYKIEATSNQLKTAVGSYIDLTNGASFDENIYPDYSAPIIRNNLDGPELALSRWGMPTPPIYIKGQADKGITNVRNVTSKHWQQWLGVASRCLVPATSFSEYGQTPDTTTGKKPLHWFARNKEQPLFFFAGVWAEWLGVRKVSEGKQEHTLFAFLTSEPNSVVAPIHPKAMPVILTDPEEMNMWMNAEWNIAKELQRPLNSKKITRLDQ